ncbi:MAG: exo-alpha-sialidase [Bacteroidales bacterium]|jgi:sialidase-1|nr:exo-alpha-sialidase [Bacteroidales bacterium]
MKKIIIALFCLMLVPVFACTRENEPSPNVPSDTVVKPEIPLNDSVFFYEQRLFAPNSYGSRNWRIPAICTLNDGTLLVVNDKRKYNEGDLPQDIDIVCRRSTDNGRTWSPPTTIIQGSGYKHGYGDPGVVVCENGDVVLTFVGGNGLFASTASDPISTYICRSTDNGVTWSEPMDITKTLWGDEAFNPVCRDYKGSFCASGNGLRLKRGEHKGRIMFVAAMCRKGANVLDNFLVYSDDNGITWKVSEMAYSGGDEAKVMELVDGRILMSIRQTGARGRNISEDGGATWGTQGTWPEMTTNACDGDMLRISATDDAAEKNILLHSIPNSMNRENVSVFISYDEGLSWQDPVLLCEGPSVYSSLTLQHDGTIGCYVEKNTPNGCELWYQNFTYAWLLSQLSADK